MNYFPSSGDNWRYFRSVGSVFFIIDTPTCWHGSCLSKTVDVPFIEEINRQCFDDCNT